MGYAEAPLAEENWEANKRLAPNNRLCRLRLETLFTVLSDALVISLATRAAFVLRFPGSLGMIKFGAYRNVFLALLAGELVLFWISKMYDREVNSNAVDIVLSCALGSLAASAVGTGIIFMYQLYGDVTGSEISRMVLMLRLLIMFVLASLWRLVFLSVRKNLGLFETRVLLLAASRDDIRVVEEVYTYSRGGHRIVGIVTDNPELEMEAGAVPILGTQGELPEVTRTHRVDEIFVVPESMSRNESVKALVNAEQTGARVRVLPSVYDSLVGTLDIRELAGIPLIDITEARASLGYSFFKRTIDIMVASLGLLLTVPLTVASCVAIKLESRGGVLFRQKRVGKGGKSFTIYKLRTMRSHDDDRDFLELVGERDARVTRVGAFLRKRRIDEIPQLLNVLKGDMSLIGPRPPQVGEARSLTAQCPAYGMRFLVRPGLTCLSHTQGRYDSIPEDRLKYDITYLKNIGFLLDLRIMLDTIKVVLTGKGAK